jgi:hypothetical protein
VTDAGGAPTGASYTTAVILFDIIDYSKLSDEAQYHTVRLLSGSLRAHLDLLACQSHLTAQELLLGIIPTGDGLYLLIRDNYADFGVLLALSLRSKVLAIREHSRRLFAGVRTCVHVGSVIPVSDIVGGRNFVGSGLNDCARFGSCKPGAAQLAEVGCADGNWVIASAAALARFESAFAFPAAMDYRERIAYTTGTPFGFEDKHGVRHVGSLVEATRYLEGPPPPMPDVSRAWRQPGLDPAADPG